MRGELNVRISGEAGQGVQTIGTALCEICRHAGLSLFAHQDYMSRVRGGNNYFQVRISDHPLRAPRARADIIIALDRASVDIHRASLVGDGVILVDAEKFGLDAGDPALFHVPLYALASRAGGERCVNSVALGAMAGLLRLPFDRVERVTRAAFAVKGDAIAGENIAAARAGYDTVRQLFARDDFALGEGRGGGALLMNGNDAIALGAIRAGCKFYSAYPMTPATSIMNVLARHAERYGIVVEQAEDEIAAVNMIIGASFAGVRAMAATSGGGFALMVEGISLAGMTETPVVVVVAQRPGPATGFPTRTEAADLEFVLHAGHGEFARAVYAPGTIEEAFSLTVRAFNI
ncbi:MAG: 2-oxoacid:acceptor oxidoreductase family protein, partial [Candidatus Aureabacteria bacterium]|nr:2-oxoacid:acceptor oxidoreductase family protein [Candidatus Auribacterota bacterium]